MYYLLDMLEHGTDTLLSENCSSVEILSPKVFCIHYTLLVLIERRRLPQEALRNTRRSSTPGKILRNVDRALVLQSQLAPIRVIYFHCFSRVHNLTRIGLLDFLFNQLF